MRTLQTASALLAMTLLSSCASMQDDDEVPVDLADVPPAVMVAALSAKPGINITSAELEMEDGEQVYELEGSVAGEMFEIEVSTTGELLEVETIDADDQ